MEFKKEIKMSPLIEGDNVLDVLFEGKVPVTIGHYSWRRCLELLLSSEKVPYVSDSDQREGVKILRGLVEDDDVFAYHVWENTTAKGVVRPGHRVLTIDERREKRERLEELEFDAFFKEETEGRLKRNRP